MTNPGKKVKDSEDEERDSEEAGQQHDEGKAEFPTLSPNGCPHQERRHKNQEGESEGEPAHLQGKGDLSPENCFAENGCRASQETGRGKHDSAQAQAGWLQLVCTADTGN